MKSCGPAHLPLLTRETVKLLPFGSTKVLLALAQGVGVVVRLLQVIKGAGHVELRRDRVFGADPEDRERFWEWCRLV